MKLILTNFRSNPLLVYWWTAISFTLTFVAREPILFSRDFSRSTNPTGRRPMENKHQNNIGEILPLMKRSNSKRENLLVPFRSDLIRHLPEVGERPETSFTWVRGMTGYIIYLSPGNGRIPHLPEYEEGPDTSFLPKSGKWPNTTFTWVLGMAGYIICLSPGNGRIHHYIKSGNLFGYVI